MAHFQEALLDVEIDPNVLLRPSQAVSSHIFAIIMALKVTVLIVGGKVKFPLELSDGSATTVAALKEIIAAAHSESPIEAQMLICGGKKLAEDGVLSDYDIKDGATIYVGKHPGTASPGKPTKSEYKSKEELVQGVMAGLSKVKAYVAQSMPDDVQMTSCLTPLERQLQKSLTWP
jgi:co-chaperonin GroES (HSP10)